jgi:hypothetical protein
MARFPKYEKAIRKSRCRASMNPAHFVQACINAHLLFEILMNPHYSPSSTRASDFMVWLGQIVNVDSHSIGSSENIIWCVVDTASSLRDGIQQRSKAAEHLVWPLWPQGLQNGDHFNKVSRASRRRHKLRHPRERKYKGGTLFDNSLASDRDTFLPNAANVNGTSERGYWQARCQTRSGQ